MISQPKRFKLFGELSRADDSPMTHGEAERLSKDMRDLLDSMLGQVPGFEGGDVISDETSIRVELTVVADNWADASDAGNSVMAEILERIGRSSGAGSGSRSIESVGSRLVVA